MHTETRLNTVVRSAYCECGPRMEADLITVLDQISANSLLDAQMLLSDAPRSRQEAPGRAAGLSLGYNLPRVFVTSMPVARRD
jgi:hypothetical protein